LDSRKREWREFCHFYQRAAWSLAGKVKELKVIKEEAAIEIHALFPDNEIRFVKAIKTMHSTIWIANVEDAADKISSKILVKHCNGLTIDQMKKEFDTQSMFYDKCKYDSIQVPRPLKVVPNKRFIIMQYLEGTNFGKKLLQMKSIDNDSLNEIINLSAIALARFHNIFTEENSGNDSKLVPTLENALNLESVNLNLAAMKSNFKDYALTRICKCYLDFTPRNIIVLDSRDLKIGLVDYPYREYEFTPHLDLARFRFSLKVMKQHPQFRFLKLNWWNIDTTYQKFIERYTSESSIESNENDWKIIDWIEREYTRQLNRIYSQSRGSIRMKTERIYMQRLMKNLLRSENDG
jgi:hypothetical protein